MTHSLGKTNEAIDTPRIPRPYQVFVGHQTRLLALVFTRPQHKPQATNSNTLAITAVLVAILNVVN